MVMHVQIAYLLHSIKQHVLENFPSKTYQNAHARVSIHGLSIIPPFNEA
jgi:hypothetical protein